MLFYVIEHVEVTRNNMWCMHCSDTLTYSYNIHYNFLLGVYLHPHNVV